jgi:hypothetical protein
MSEIGKGYQVVTADIAVNTAGDPVVIYGVTIVSTGTAGVVLLRNGDTVAGTVILTLNGTVSTDKTIDFGGVGIVFPDGCFVDIDANVTSCTVVYEKV